MPENIPPSEVFEELKEQLKYATSILGTAREAFRGNQSDQPKPRDDYV